MINLKQYRSLCKASDLILDAASDNDEIVSIPMLHVLREHPQCLKLYEFIFNKGSNYQAQSINLFKKSIGLIRSTLFDCKVSNIPKNLNKDSKKLIIVSHITNPNQCSNIEDEYFGNLHNDLLSFSNIQPIVLLINQTSISSSKLSKKLSINNIDRIVIPKSSGLFNELKIFFKLFISVSGFTRSLKLKDSVASSMLNTISKPSTFLSGMSALRIGFFVEKIVKITNSNYIFTTYEGHSRERIIFSSARKANQEILCFAYQHSILNKFQYALTKSMHKKYNPDHIFCCGRITKDLLSNLNSLNDIKISILGSPKGLPISILKNPIDGNKNLTFLFLPEGMESEYQIFYKFILECSKVFPNSNFIWRSHPLLDIEKLDFFKRKILPSNITISKNLFDQDVGTSNIAIYRGTAAIIRAVMGNLTPIYLQIKDEIGIDIMHSLKLNRVFSVSDLKSIIQTVDLQENMEDNIKFCQNYFKPIEYKSLIKVTGHYDF